MLLAARRPADCSCSGTACSSAAPTAPLCSHNVLSDAMYWASTVVPAPPLTTVQGSGRLHQFPHSHPAGWKPATLQAHPCRHTRLLLHGIFFPLMNQML